MVQIMQSHLLLTLALARATSSAPRNPTPGEEWVAEQNDQAFNRDAYDGRSWAKSSKKGLSPREPQHRIEVADSNGQDTFPPTRTYGDFAPTKTYAMERMRRAPQATFSCGTSCFTFACEFPGPLP